MSIREKAEAATIAKPLEWSVVSPGWDDDEDWQEALTPFGHYTLTYKEGHALHWMLEPFSPYLASNYATEAEAKAAAQKHYETGVRVAAAALLDEIETLRKALEPFARGEADISETAVILDRGVDVREALAAARSALSHNQR